MRIAGNDVIAKILVGSRAYGTNIGGSDWDYKGVYIQNPLDLFLNGQKNFIKISEDEIYYELGYFVSLCLNQNPTILEMLYAPEDCVVYSTEHWRRLINKREFVLSKKARHSYKGYIAKELRELTRGPKQAAHILRLALTAHLIATTETLPVRLPIGMLECVKRARKGDWTVEDTVKEAMVYFHKLEWDFSSSKLPDEPNTEKILEKVKDIKTEYFKRYDNTRRYSEDIQVADV